MIWRNGAGVSARLMTQTSHEAKAPTTAVRRRRLHTMLRSLWWKLGGCLQGRLGAVDRCVEAILQSGAVLGSGLLSHIRTWAWVARAGVGAHACACLGSKCPAQQESIHPFITRLPFRRSGALQQTSYGSPPACHVGVGHRGTRMCLSWQQTSCTARVQSRFRLALGHVRFRLPKT